MPVTHPHGFSLTLFSSLPITPTYDFSLPPGHRSATMAPFQVLILVTFLCLLLVLFSERTNGNWWTFLQLLPVFYITLGFTQMNDCLLHNSCWFLAWLPLQPWRQGNMFLWNTGWLSPDYMALYTSRENLKSHEPVLICDTLNASSSPQTIQKVKMTYCSIIFTFLNEVYCDYDELDRIHLGSMI
jgi:hypothetical protein